MGLYCLPVTCLGVSSLQWVKIARLVANSVDPDQMVHNVAPDLGLHCFTQACLNEHLR